MALPDDITLLRALHVDGLDAEAIAAGFDVPVDSVNARLAAMGRAIDTPQNRDTTELMAAIEHFRATGEGAEDAVLRAHRRGWQPERIRSRTGVDLDTINRILADAS